MRSVSRAQGPTRGSFGKLVANLASSRATWHACELTRRACGPLGKLVGLREAPKVAPCCALVFALRLHDAQINNGAKVATKLRRSIRNDNCLRLPLERRPSRAFGASRRQARAAKPAGSAPIEAPSVSACRHVCPAPASVCERLSTSPTVCPPPVCLSLSPSPPVCRPVCLSVCLDGQRQPLASPSPLG